MSPAAGYPDWQRVSNMDLGSVLYQRTNINVGTGLVSPILDVSRYLYVTGSQAAMLQPLAVRFDWFMDIAGNQLIATRFYVLHPSIFHNAQIHIANLGPYVQISHLPIGVAGNVYVVLYASNRPAIGEFIPQNPYLIGQQSVPVANGAAAAVYPTDYWAGSVHLYTEPPATGWFADLYTEDINGTARKLDSYQLGVSRFTQLVYTPAGLWWVQITNLSGANGTFVISVTQLGNGDT